MTWVAVGPGQPARPFARLDGVEGDDPAFDLRDGLLRHDEDVAVADPVMLGRRLDEQRRQIVSLPKLRDAMQSEDPNLGNHGRPVSVMPACAL